ncbi:MAG: M15 family metallopeptidase [Spirochaetales bacterium]|nr:M15 family metallopeptidase [Spirochaetales bacterium]
MNRVIFVLCFLMIVSIWADDSANGQDADLDSQILEAGVLVEKEEGRKIMEAFLKGYPSRISRLEERHGDYAVLIGEEWYYYAKGKLLREDLLAEEGKYTAFSIYNYYLGPLRYKELSDEEKERIRDNSRERDRNPPTRHPGFFNALWEAYDEKSAWDNMKSMLFLGHRIEVHWRLLEDFASIEMELLEMAKTDKELADFIGDISSAAAYNYRRIAGTRSLSFHSYGIALDIVTRNPEKKPAYWYWIKSLEWYSIPAEDRYSPPQKFIDVFENHGFVWGGKWMYFDAIHYEYRPEVLYLNGIFKDSEVLFEDATRTME